MNSASENERLEELECEIDENSLLITKNANDSNDKLANEKLLGNNVALVPPNNHRRSDEPAELSFEKCKWSQNSESLVFLFYDYISFLFILISFSFNIDFLLFSVPENHEEKYKRIQIENALDDSRTTQDEWRKFAKSEYGLINGT